MTEPLDSGCLVNLLHKLGTSQRQLLSGLVAQRGVGQPGHYWQQYINQPRALVYVRPTPAGDDPQGMRAILVVPLERFVAVADFAGPAAWRAAVTVLGVSAHRRAAPADSGQPRLFAFEAARLPSDLLSPMPNPRQVMSVPRLLPGWLPVRVQGASARWQALAAAPGFEGTTLAQYLLQCARAEQRALLNRTRGHGWGSGCAGEKELNELAHAMLALEAELIENAIASFCRHLNPVVAQGCLLRRGALVPAEYNWLAAGQHARHWQWRMDALELFPALCTSAAPHALPVVVSPAMAKRSEALRRLKDWADVGSIPGAQTIAHTVDVGLPLIRHLAASFKVKPATIRALRHVSAGMTPALERPPIGWPHLLGTLDRLPPERYPHSEEQWNAFSTLYTEGHAVLAALSCVKAPGSHQWEEGVMHPWLARAARDWVKHLERHREAFRGLSSLSRASEFTRCLDAWFAFTRLHHARRRKLVQALGRLQVNAWQRLLNRWVALVGTPETTIRASTGITAPEPTLADLPGVDALHLRVTLLNHSRLLQAEGNTMRHCIFTYWDNLPFNPYLIFAIGTPDSPHRSTALLVYKRKLAGRWGVHVGEQRAFANGPASATSQRVAEALSELLSSPAGQPFMDAVDLWRASLRDALLRNPPAPRPDRDAARQQQRQQQQFAQLKLLLEELSLCPSEDARP